ncbi:MAG: GldM family protein [Brumimicrobium sp.]|nr:GldM family protein [Brumimicrobium sp.]
MAGGKETPRQKMIGMMYLVLTALLALNVSKEIIAAFITINDKLDSSGQIAQKKGEINNLLFSKKRMALKEKKADMTKIDLWESKATKLNEITDETIHFILQNSNEMIKTAEGKDWIEKTNKKGQITSLKPLFDISNMDNYDIPTNLFIGGNPNTPNEKGQAIREKILNYRNQVTGIMGTYQEGTKQWKFDPKLASSDLKKALLQANPKDTASLRHIYQTLSIPETVKVKDGGTIQTKPWVSAMFDHAPIVAAAALFTALKVDVLNASSLASDFMLAKVEAPLFNFNKIEPLAFAHSSYINQGDSLNLNIMIAAYDSTENHVIKYGINEDTLPEKWKTTSGKISLPGNLPGNYAVRGQIGVKENNEIKFRNWAYNYTVGKPSSNVSLPNLNILYRGNDNEISGGVSGFTNYRLVAVNNVRIQEINGKKIAIPGRERTASIKVIGIAADGSETPLGTHEFIVKDMPTPFLKLGSVEENETASISQVRAARSIFPYYEDGIPLPCNFRVDNYTITIDGLPRPIPGQGNQLSTEAMRNLAMVTPGKEITIETWVVNLKDNSRRKKRTVYKVR